MTKKNVANSASDGVSMLAQLLVYSGCTVTLADSDFLVYTDPGGRGRCKHVQMIDGDKFIITEIAGRPN